MGNEGITLCRDILHERGAMCYFDRQHNLKADRGFHNIIKI